MKAILFGIGFGFGFAGLTGSSLDRTESGAVVLVLVAACLLAWWGGRRKGIAVASASAVSISEATATATAEAVSAASAQGGSVNLQVVLPGQYAPVSVERFTPLHRQDLTSVAENRLQELDPEGDPGETLASYMEDGGEALMARVEAGEV